PEEHRPQPAMDSVSASMEHLKEARQRELHISYPMDLLHLTPLSVKELTTWKNQEGHLMNRASALDSLYRLKRN
ncbi:MAG: hypothetical protein WA085_09480, partial [Sphingobium sp.]